MWVSVQSSRGSYGHEDCGRFVGYFLMGRFSGLDDLATVASKYLRQTADGQNRPPPPPPPPPHHHHHPQQQQEVQRSLNSQDAIFPYPVFKGHSSVSKKGISCVSQATPPVAHEPHGILRSNELSVGELVGCREWSDDVGIHVVHIPCSFQRCRPPTGTQNRGDVFGVLVAWKVISYT